MNTVRRRRNAEGQQAGLAPLPEQASGPQAIGELLRARREELGQDLRDVSHMLRIRYPYLEAIEGGRVGELPGPTYAVGFVRAYADYLGLERDRKSTRLNSSH